MNIIEMTTKFLEYYINLVEKVVTRLGRDNCNYERSSTMGKMLSKSITKYRGSFVKGRVK